MMAHQQFFRPYEDPLLMRLKEEPYEDTIENDVNKIKDANLCTSLYPEISFIPLKRAMEFSPERFFPPNFFKPEMDRLPPPAYIKPEPEMFLPPPYIKPEVPPTPAPSYEPPNSMADPETPHAKRKSLPLEKCHICKKYFRRMNTHLQKHAERQFHFAEQPFACKFCSKVFSNPGNLQIHLRIHTGAKPYVCAVCSKAFTQSCNLTNHMRTHTGEKPFKCPHCSRAFTQSGNLTNHIRLHLDRKPFKCHFCDRAFRQSGNLNSHLKNNHKDEMYY